MGLYEESSSVLHDEECQGHRDKIGRETPFLLTSNAKAGTIIHQVSETA